jgi:hypothetical protein
VLEAAGRESLQMLERGPSHADPARGEVTFLWRCLMRHLKVLPRIANCGREHTAILTRLGAEMSEGQLNGGHTRVGRPRPISARSQQ